MRSHCGGCYLTEVDTQIDLILLLVIRQRLVKNRESVDALGQPLEPFLTGLRRIAGLQPNECGARLEIVFYPMLQLPQQVSFSRTRSSTEGASSS